MSDVSTQSESVALTSDKVSSVDVAYDEILQRIVSGEIREGEPIRGSALAKKLGLSRTPVIQAINRLSSTGLLKQELNHRATVASGAERWFISLHEVRILLEPHAAGVAAHNLSPEALSQLRSLANEFERQDQVTEQREAAFRFDHALHTTIAEASGNLMIQTIVHQCMSFKRFAYRIPNDPPERLLRSHGEHLEILRALQEKDSDTASAAMLFHLRSTFRGLSEPKVV